MEDGRMQGQWVVTFRNGTSHSYEYFNDEMVQNFSGTRTSLTRNNVSNGGTVSVPLSRSPRLQRPSPLAVPVIAISSFVCRRAAALSVAGCRRTYTMQ